MKPGSTFTRRGQTYRCLGETDHWTQQGAYRPLVRVESHCTDCGNRFVFKTTRSHVKRAPSLNRRCPRHSDPGKPVKIAVPPPPAKLREAARRLAGLVDEHHALEARRLALAVNSPALALAVRQLRRVREALPRALGALRRAQGAVLDVRCSSLVDRVDREGARAEAAAAEEALAEMKVAEGKRRVERRAERVAEAATAQVARTARAEQAAAKRAPRRSAEFHAELADILG